MNFQCIFMWVEAPLSWYLFLVTPHGMGNNFLLQEKTRELLVFKEYYKDQSEAFCRILERVLYDDMTYNVIQFKFLVIMIAQC